MNDPQSSSAADPDRTLIHSPGDGEPNLGAPPDALIEKKLGRYELLRVLGRGGMGVVYLARDPALERLVAVKVLAGERLASAELLARFQREAKAIAQVQHPNVAHVYEVGSQDDRPFLVMEYVSGGTLADRIQAALVEPKEAAQIVQTLALGVHAAHEKGIVHRDLKPGNVLVTTDGTLKITDFGLAKRLDVADQATVTGEILGTPSYMAPEQAGGILRDVGPACDVYALGAILYELLAGRPPFRAPDPVQTVLLVLSSDAVSVRRLAPQSPRDLSTICHKCLEKSPKRRYASAAELADDLGRFREGLPIHARPIRRWEKVWRWSRRRPAAAALILVSGLALAALTVGGAWYNAQLQAELSRSQRLIDEGESFTQWVLGEHVNDISRLRGGSSAQKKMVERSKGYLDGFVANAGDETRLVGTIARFYLRLAEITDTFELGDAGVALEFCEEAERLYERAIADDPENAELQLGLLNAQRLALNLRAALGRPQDQRAELERMRSVLQSLKPSGKIEPDRLLGLDCYLRVDIAWLDQASGRIEEAVTGLRETLRDAETLPNTPGHRDTVRLIHSALSKALYEQGSFPAALEHTQWLVDFAQQRLDEAPDDALMMYNYASNLVSHGDVLSRLRPPQESLEAYAAAEKTLRKLVADDETNGLFLSKLVGLLDRMATMRNVQNDFAGARPLLEEAIRTHQNVLDRQPQHVEHRQTARMLYSRLGSCLDGLGETDASIEALQRALEIQKDLLAEDANRMSDWQGLGEVYDELGRAHLSRWIEHIDGPDGQRSLEFHKQSVAAYEEIAARGELSASQKNLLAMARKTVANLENGLARFAAAGTSSGDVPAGESSTDAPRENLQPSSRDGGTVGRPATTPGNLQPISLATATSAVGQCLDRVSGQAEERPLVQRHGADALVERDRGFVPVEHGPFHPAAPPLVGQGRQMHQQGPADAFPPRLGPHVQILQIKPSAADERRKVVKEECKPGRLAVQLRDDHFRRRPLPEQLLLQGCFRRDNRVGQTFVLGKLSDKGENEWDVLREGASNRDVNILGSHFVAGGRTGWGPGPRSDGRPFVGRRRERCRTEFDGKAEQRVYYAIVLRSPPKAVPRNWSHHDGISCRIPDMWELRKLSASAAKPFSRMRLACAAALCAAISSAASAAPPAENGAPQGQLVVKLPRVCAGRYWIYLDGALVRAGRIIPRYSRTMDFVQVNTPDGIVLMDRDGVAIRHDGDRLVFVREDLRDELLFDQYTSRAPLGRHKVELAVRSLDVFDERRRSTNNPFTFWSSSVDVVEDETVTVEFSPLMSEGAGVTTLSVYVAIDAEGRRRYERDVQTALERVESHAIVPAVRDVDGSPTVGSRIVLDLPDDLGGSREFDAQQIRAMGDWLKRGGSLGISAYFSDSRLTAHFETFNRVARRMERAMAEELSELVDVVSAPLAPLPEAPQDK